MVYCKIIELNKIKILKIKKTFLEITNYMYNQS